MGIIWSMCCRKNRGGNEEYKKLDVSPTGAAVDLEAGGDDDEDWDEFPTQQQSASVARQVAVSLPDPDPDPEPEPESDPFAELGMAPTIKPTKRHTAQSMWAQNAAPTSSRFAMTADEASGDVGWGGEDDLTDTLGLGDRRRAAEQRREQRRRQREENGTGAPPRDKPGGRGLAATRVVG